MEPAADHERRRFRLPLRKYQQLALDAFDLDRPDDSRFYLVLPPGAGKTVVGLEAARRIGRRTLVLAPNNAVLGQWVDTWNEDFPAADGGPVSPCGTDRTLTAPLTVLTYQSIAVIEETGSATDRRRVVAGADRAALLDLLHPNGREVVERAAGLGPWTLVLDECHHLLALWGALVRALVDTLGPGTAVIGLTATPVALLTGWQRELSDDLFGAPDFEVLAPAWVKEGDLAPYQELAYLTAPTADEDTWLVSETARFADLQVELIDHRLGTIPLVEWLRRRVTERGSPDSVAVSWAAFEAAEPQFARAALRFVHAGFIPVPDGARIREQHRAAPDAEDWVSVLSDFRLGHLQRSDDRADAEALTAIKRVLPSLGYRLTARGVRATVSPVDRLCGLSEAKVGAAVHILETEDAALGVELRALVLCDFERQTGRQPASLAELPLDAESGSARLAFAALATARVAGPGGLLPLLVTGQTFACPAALGAQLVRFCANFGYPVTTEPLDAIPDLLRVLGAGRFTSRQWVRVATAFFDAGHARVLVGTRALLGEGWDCAAVNVSIDLTTAATPTAITQMRGRSLRLDPARPDKVADNWTVCCVASGHPRGRADYERLVRKHDAYFAPTAAGGIESGLSHCDPALSPFGPPSDSAGVTARALARADDRDGARERWGIGRPYVGVEAATLRIRAARALGAGPGALPAAALIPSVDAARPNRRRRLLAGLGSLTLVGVPGLVVDASAGAPAGIAGAAAAALVGAAGFGAFATVRGRRLAAAPPALERLSWALADALRSIKAVSGGTVTMAPTPDGWTRCELAGVPRAESALFAAALDELLAPLSEPKFLIGRVVIAPPTSRWGRTAYAARASLGLALDAAVSWHGVPSALAGSKAKRQALAEAWTRHVGPARLLAADSSEGLAVLDLFRGEDPFSVVTQLRTTWS
jgi:superfamily II DNA or RNA helicase